jgi:hypothetical protein
LRHQAEEALRARPALPTWQRRVVERFAVERRNGWYTLLNEFAPDTPSTRPDAVLVGPLGILVVLLRDQEPDRETSRSAFVWVAELLTGAETPRGMLSEAAVRTVVVRPDRFRPATGYSGEHVVITESQLDRILCQGERLLDPVDVTCAARHLDNRTFDLTPIAWNPQPVPEQRGPEEIGAPDVPSGLFDVAQLRADRLDNALRDSFDDWRTFLDDTQLSLVRRHYGGPARITGPAGTGKSVLALHRLAYLARRVPGQLLFTTHVSTLPNLARRQFHSLAPQLAHRVEFTHLHAWARDLLAERGRPTAADDVAIDAVFREVWARTGHDGPLGQHRWSPLYWKEEIDRVIKGRGIRSWEAYQTVARYGRGARLSRELRAHAWEFYCEYERALSEQGVFDHNDVLMRAFDELGRTPLPEPYSAVVVDEVQDLTLVGLRLAHRISGDAPNQLMLVGDGQQQVYAGGWRLSETDISLRGRGEVLHRNYRNRAAILDAASAVEAVNRFDDVEGGPPLPLRAATPVLLDGRVVRWEGTAQEDALVEAIGQLEDTSNVAVLTTTKRDTDHWLNVLRQAGIRVRPLSAWTGESTSEVHVGTIHRAKGTEFRAVFLPDDQRVSWHHDEREIQARQRLVAITRARDHLWIGTVTT